MHCAGNFASIEQHADGELQGVELETLRAHLAGCAECRAALDAHRGFARHMTSSLTYYPASDRLRARVRTAVRMTLPVAPDRFDVPAATPWVHRRWRTAAIAATLALSVLGTRDVIGVLRSSSASTSRNRELVANHVRSLMPGHLMDVESSDRHTVKPWFEGRIDISPPVFDFTSDSIPLLGGRLDVVGGHSAAALVYRRRSHIINLFVWAADSTDETIRDGQQAGHHVIMWRRGGMRFAAVSTLALSSLRQFAEMYVARDSAVSAAADR